MALHQVLERLSDFSVLFYEFSACLFNSTQDPTIYRNHGWEVSADIRFVPLLEGNIPSICERLAMKKKLLEKIIIIRKKHYLS